MAHTFPVETVNLTPSIKTGQARTLQGGYNYVQIQLISSTPAWSSLVGQGNLTWGVQWSTDGGATWQLLVGGEVALGALDRSGNMPLLGGSLYPAVPGNQLRLYGFADVNVAVTFQVTVLP